MKIKKNNIKVILSKDYECLFSKNYFCEFILLFSLFLLLFIGLTHFFDIIYESHYTITANFYIYLQYFQFQFQQNKRISDGPKYH